MPKKLMLIINPVAGKKQAAKNLAEIIRIFMINGWQVTTFVTGRSGDAAEYAARFGGEYDRIVCSGGDGTLNETAAGLLCAGLHTPLGYLPAGSTNDLAEFLHIPTNLSEAAERAAAWQPHLIDVGGFNERFFLNVAEFGAFSWLPYSTPQPLKNVLGYYAYILDGVKDLSKIRSYHLQLSSGGLLHEGDFIFGAVCSATSMGGVFDLPKNAIQPDDGQFEVLLIRSPNTLIDLQEVITALRLKDYSNGHVEFFRTDSLEVKTEVPFDWAVDGERAAGCSCVTIRNLPGKLPLVY